MTVGTFEMFNTKNDDSYEDGELDTRPATPMTVHTFARPGLGVRGPHHGGEEGGAAERRAHNHVGVYIVHNPLWVLALF